MSQLAGLPAYRGLVRVAAGGRLGLALLGWLVLVAPLAALASHLSVSILLASLTAPGALGPLQVSLAASAVALVAMIAIGTPLAYLLARHRLPVGWLWQAGLLLLLMMPPLVVGLLLVFLVGPLTPIGGLLAHLHLNATNTFLALVIAESYEAAPYYVLGAQAAFAAVDPQLEQQAGLLGDRPVRVLRRVSLPLAAPGLAVALATAWARAMGAFGAVIIVAYHPYGLPLQIWTSLQETGLASALPFAFLLLAVAVPVPLAAYAWSARTRRGERGGGGGPARRRPDRAPARVRRPSQL